MFSLSARLGRGVGRGLGLGLGLGRGVHVSGFKMQHMLFSGALSSR